MGIKIISFARCHTWWANDKSCSNLTDSMHIKLFYWNSNLLKRLQNRKLKTVNNRNSGLKRVHSFRFYLKNSIQTTLFDIRWKNREEIERREREGKSFVFLTILNVTKSRHSVRFQWETKHGLIEIEGTDETKLFVTRATDISRNIFLTFKMKSWSVTLAVDFKVFFDDNTSTISDDVVVVVVVEVAETPVTKVSKVNFKV